MKKRKKIIIIVVALFVFFFVIGPAVASPIIYESIFGGRITSKDEEAFDIEDFDGLEAVRYEFDSDRGDTLVGYWYSNEDVEYEEIKGIVFVVHGFGGGGQRTYMDVTDYFTRNGYYVFAYDATGNDESKGKSIIGLPHGVKDLDAAIDFVEESGIFPELPIFLWGHSWGGYCVSSVLTLHPEVEAVCEMSGFNSAAGMMVARGEQYASKAADCGVPFLLAYQAMKCGKGSMVTAVDGFNSSEASVICVTSLDDTTVAPKLGYDIFYKKFKDDERFTFYTFEDRGHVGVRRVDGNGPLDEELFDEIDAIFVESLED